MAAGEMEQFARIAAIAAGILFGGWALSSVIWVWTKKQIYAYGGSALSVVGIILMGLSIYKTIDVRAAPDGIGIKLAEMEKLLKDQGQAQQATQTKLAQFPSDLGLKITELDKTVKEQGAVQAAQFQKLDGGGSMVQRTSGTASPQISDDYWLLPKTTVKYGNIINSINKPDGTSIWYFPDPSDAKYIEGLQNQITAAKAKSDSSELSSLLMKLGQAYQASGQVAEALTSYREGLALLETQPKK
jgi:hypothetical protein